MTFYVTEVFVSLLRFSHPAESSSAPSLPILAGSAAAAALQPPPLSCAVSSPAQLCSAPAGLSVQEMLSVTPGEPVPWATPAGHSLGSSPAHRKQQRNLRLRVINSKLASSPLPAGSTELLGAGCSGMATAPWHGLRSPTAAANGAGGHGHHLPWESSRYGRVLIGDLETF